MIPQRGRVPEKAVTVGLILPGISRTVAEEHLAELGKLVEAAGGAVAVSVFQERRAPDSGTYIGRGKAEEIDRLVAQHGAKVVVFDDDLSPAQIKNLEQIIPTKVIDRSALILDIFARRARSREARTQVELAQLNYLLPRLTRQWSHLSRQAGGIGTRGVGETQLEIDRRIIRRRIAHLREELARIEKTRETQRRGRESVFAVALVGYTNAGKSTLFNRLTGGSTIAVDQLFATLDAKLNRMEGRMPRETVVIDTVGFIRKLPHHLVASFRSTMEEAVAADLVLHLIDSSHPQVEEQRAVGNEVLEDLGIAQAKVLEVFNKNDQPAAQLPHDRADDAVFASALTGNGIVELIEAIRRRELAAGETVHLSIPTADSRAVAALHQSGIVYESSTNNGTFRFVAWIPSDQIHRFEEYLGNRQ